MSFVREPEGIDFVINGKPLAEKQKQAISAFIQADKAAATPRSTRRKAQDSRKHSEKHSA